MTRAIIRIDTMSKNSSFFFPSGKIKFVIVTTFITSNSTHLIRKVKIVYD